MNLKTATYKDAVFIAGLFRTDPETVWEVIRGKQYSYYAQLTAAVGSFLYQKKHEQEY